MLVALGETPLPLCRKLTCEQMLVALGETLAPQSWIAFVFI